jgi:hypothetical protein
LLEIRPVREEAMKRLLIVTALGLAAVSAAWAADKKSAPYVPGLGEFMTSTQMRHAKLWFAGSSGNWPLAAYELDEIKEGLDDAVRLHPKHDDMPVGVMIRKNLGAPLGDLGKAIESRNADNFRVAFDRLTDACNACHSSAGHEFIRIQRPTAPPATNQVYTPNP